MKHLSTFLLAGSLGLFACGDDNDPDTQADGSSDVDSSTPEDAGRDAAPPGGDASMDSAVSDAGRDASSGDASGADAGPKPIKVSCGASIEPIDCPVCANSAGCATPTYTENGDGTVTSSCCGLVWQKTQENVDRTWPQAYDYCAGLPLAGGGFRLPTIAELNTLLIGDSWPTIDLTVFPNTPGEPVWSSTEYASGVAWEIAFSKASAQGGELMNGENVRCVR